MDSEMSQEGRFPFGRKQRAGAIGSNANKIKHFVPNGIQKIRDGHYSWTDSTLDGFEKRGRSFLETFAGVLPEEYGTLQEYIEGVLDKRKGKAVGIEFGGPGRRLFRAFSPGFFEETFGITLVDYYEDLKPDKFFGPDKIRHTVIQEDALSPTLYESMRERLGGRKVDLIIERLGRGMEFVPVEPYAVSKILQTWYGLLGEGGILLCQVPVALNSIFAPWAKILKTQYKNVLDSDYAIGSADDDIPMSVMRLQKLPGAPQELPMLDPRTVRAISKGRGAKEV